MNTKETQSWQDLGRLYSKRLERDKSFIQDKWQTEVLAYEGNITIRAGRQVGKSIIVAKKACKLALEKPGTTTLMIAAAQRQSSLIFEKTLIELKVIHGLLLERAGGFEDNKKLSLRQNTEARRLFENKFGLFEELPTKTEIRLKNGSRIYSLPAGKTGIYIKGFSVDFLIVDEAAFVPEMVWMAVTPMIAVSRKEKLLGWIILLSTPFGKGGYFYNSHLDPDFKQYHISAENCPRISREFLRKEKQRLSKTEYAQEYLGEFTDEFNQFFKTELIKKRMTFISWIFEEQYSKEKNYYLGVDVARMGEDENAFVIAEMEGQKIKIVYIETSEKKTIPETVGRILKLDERWKFRKIFIDDAGLGAGAFDLLQEKLNKRKVVGLNNSQRAISEERNTKLLKEDLYCSALVIMEKEPPQIDIISDLDLIRSLKSMTYEYTADKNLKVYGADSHLSEAFVRAVWCMKDKGLRLFFE